MLNYNHSVHTFKCDLLHFLFKHVVAKIDESRYKYMDHFDKCLPSASTFNFDRTMRIFLFKLPVSHSKSFYTTNIDSTSFSI